jgi:hypothetical protein
MIYAPKPGDRVQLHYAARRMPHHGRTGTVRAFNPKARGPRNALVELDGIGLRVVVPRGNLRRPLSSPP